MDLTLSPSEQAFRDELRGWIEANDPGPEPEGDEAGFEFRRGDEWVVTGQKVWTTMAHHATWCMLVARTDPDAPKHAGLTYFLMPMHQDAVQVRPLVQITGEPEFNELFLEEARIPDANIVG